jgi:RNA polymerase sigma factor (sigma-70 family)
MMAGFTDAFAELFDAHFARLFRFLHRWSGDAELAEDAAQDAFVRLYARGTMPDRPDAWLVTVALNIARNARSARVRQARLLTPARGAHAQADQPPTPAEATETSETRARVRAALSRLSERDRGLLLLRAEGFAYRDIAEALQLKESSIGTMLARARDAFRTACEENINAS